MPILQVRLPINNLKVIQKYNKKLCNLRTKTDVSRKFLGLELKIRQVTYSMHDLYEYDMLINQGDILLQLKLV